MNDKDKEAFEKWVKDDFGEDDLPLPLMEHTWEAACEYKDKELLEWKEAAGSEADEVNRLQAENKKLREALQFYADFKNWRTVTVSKSNQRFCILTGSDLEYFKEPNQDSYCGKRAREALKKVGEE